MARPPRLWRTGGKHEEETLEVVCRIAPYRGTSPCAIALDGETVRSNPSEGLVKRNGDPYEEKSYKFAYVFDGNDTQRDVFNRCAVDFVGDLVNGRNSLLFTYGVTGSGKTYTVTGRCEDSGILPRAVDVIFNSVPKLADKCVFYPDGRNGFGVRSPTEAAAARKRLASAAPPKYVMTPREREVREVPGFRSSCVAAVFVSYVEIYNNYCYDLLDQSLTDNRSGESKLIRTPADGPAYVDRLTEVEVQSSDELLMHYMRGQDRRKVGKTLLNRQSSRSHSIFTVRLVMAPEDKDGQPIVDGSKPISSEIFLVDLAGSERTKRTGNILKRFDETCTINKSLLVLRRCFEALRKNQRARRQAKPVPYRDQKLTLLFKSFFEGHGRIRMIICLNPQPSDYEENEYVLEFAEMAKSVGVPESHAPDLLLDGMSNLTFPRRDVVRWHAEMDHQVGIQAVEPDSFDEPPKIELDDPADENSIERLRQFYTNRIIQRQQYITTVRHNANEFTSKLKERLCHSDLDLGRLDHVVKLRELSAIVTVRNKPLQVSFPNLIKCSQSVWHENNALEMRFGHYESEGTNERRRGEDARLREAKLMAEAARAQHLIHKARL
ncbi:Kinesin motor domain containing protein, partial [Aphelenchoides avenae]